MIKIHGSSMSRTSRVLWALEELGLKYEHNPIPTTATRTPEHLRLNPNGHVPVLEDDGTVLWESAAINLYLAEKYGKGMLWPASVEDRGQAYKWSIWAMTELEPHLVTILQNRIFLPPEQRNERAASEAAENVKAPLKVLDDHLKGRSYLIGDNFTIADVTVANVASIAMMARLDLSAAPNVQAWLQKCAAREAWQRASKMK